MRLDRPTRVFLAKAAAFLAVQAALLALFCALYRVDTSSYISMSLLKERHLRASESPRIILVGGSAVAFGLNSPRIQGAFERPVVNMGLQGSLGLEVKLSEVLPSLGSGDWVVLSLEYQHYVGTIREGLTLWGWLEQDWTRWRHLSLPDVQALTDSGHLYLRNITTTALRRYVLGRVPRSKPPYDPGSFNEQGDVVGHRGLDAPGFGEATFLSHRFPMSQLDDALDTLRSFRSVARAKGAQVFVYFPPVPRSQVGEVRAKLLDIAAAIRSEGLPVLNHPNEVFWEDPWFFDTLYHLTYAGQVRNTEMLIRALRREATPK